MPTISSPSRRYRWRACKTLTNRGDDCYESFPEHPEESGNNKQHQRHCDVQQDLRGCKNEVNNMTITVHGK